MQQKHQHPSSWSIVVTFCMQFCLCFELGLIGEKKHERKKEWISKRFVDYCQLVNFPPRFPTISAFWVYPAKWWCIICTKNRARQWARMRNHGLCKNCNRIQQNLLFMHPPPLRSPFSCNINQLTLLV